MRINLSLAQMTAFLRLAETGSFSAASRSLGLSQPALSRTIRLMEEALGSRLFDRDTRNVALTPAGAALRPIAQRMAAEFDSAVGELGRFLAGQRGRVIVAALPSVAAVLLPRVLGRFRASHPQVEVTILDELSNSVVSAVADGIVDFGLSVRPVPSELLGFRAVVSDDFELVCELADPLAGRAEVTWRDLAERPFIAMSPNSSVRAMTDAAFLQIGVPVKPLYECGHLATTVSLVAAGLGVTALPKLTLPLVNAAGLVTVPLGRPTMRRTIGLVTRIGRSLSPAARDLYELLSDSGRGIPGLQTSSGAGSAA